MKEMHRKLFLLILECRIFVLLLYCIIIQFEVEIVQDISEIYSSGTLDWEQPYLCVISLIQYLNTLGLVSSVSFIYAHNSINYELIRN